MSTDNYYIRRRLLSSLTAHLDQPEITVLVGPRQSGKTTILKRLESELRAGGRKTLWLNLDFEDDFRHVASEGALLQKIQLELGSGGGVVFIDEIQRRENAGLFLKGLYDQGLPWKFVVSGSGSIELKEKISESLVGRKRLFELSTVSFGEFADFRTGYRYTDRLRDYFRTEPSKTDQLFREYLMYGGYPRVVLADTHQEKMATINEIFRSYLEKDIVYLLRVEKSESFSNLVRVLATQSGKMVSYSELSATLGLSLATVKLYLWYLEKTYIIDKVTPWYTNIRKEITKAPVYYFRDIGLRNFAAGSFGALSDSEAGFAFQNVIHAMLKERFPLADSTIHYWRTKDKAEVDFVLRSGDTVTPLEVKYRDMKKLDVRRSFLGFLTRYHPEFGYIVNRNYSDEALICQTRVRCLPYWELMFEEAFP
ncbi:ATP-binding protein [Syntrophus aciditrophicus]|uniref:ATPase n=1 Tax=Syntrophus aciditrophicus (strain SB) TaxID=56780 RepID=Q2LST6_SYNAS|nr:ATP-binding protein [Syntrophus aciditrophicus]ABC77150.1 ATPase [Syntrophus aciditrophicus SB]